MQEVVFEAGRKRILDGLTLAVQEGEIHAILGANGSGKSTMAALLMGCEGYSPTGGVIRFAGVELAPLKIHERARLGLTLAWQEPARFEGVTVRQYLAAGRQELDVEPYLKMVGLSAERYLPRLVDKTLSGGERQRIELAAVLAMRPRLAILDEPDSGIDMLSVQSIMHVIRGLRERGSSVLLITHNEEVALVADRGSQLCGGRIIFSGDPREAAAHFQGRTCVRCDGRECTNDRA
jgi:Fe-S cluster assembly ATP-binding protein